MADSNYRVENRQREVSEPGSNKENLEDLNQQLQQLIEQIKPLPPKSKKRRKLINDLIGTIQPELIKKSLWVVSVTKENELFVEDALLLTYINIQKYLTKYKPEKGKVMNWVIGIYKNEFYKLLKKNKQAGLTKIPGGGGKKIVNVAILLLVKCDLHRLGLLLGQNYSPSKDKKSIEFISIDDPANHYAPEKGETNEVYGNSFDELVEKNPQKLLENIKKFIETDPKDFLEKIVTRNKATKKQITLQTALLMRLQDKKLKEISEETGVPLKSISSLIDRNMAEVKIYITDHTGIKFS